jgi:hypothetical protein
MAGRIRKLWQLVPITRTAAALWAWRNRRELGRWLGFAVRALPSLPDANVDRNDILTEARLRAALSRDERTRGLPTLAVHVRNGRAILDGRLAPPLHELVYSLAEDTRGVRAIDCRIEPRGSLGPPRSHVHAAAHPIPTGR